MWSARTRAVPRAMVVPPPALLLLTSRRLSLRRGRLIASLFVGRTRAISMLILSAVRAKCGLVAAHRHPRHRRRHVHSRPSQCGRHHHCLGPRGAPRAGQTLSVACSGHITHQRLHLRPPRPTASNNWKASRWQPLQPRTRSCMPGFRSFGAILAQELAAEAVVILTTPRWPAL